MPVALLGNDRSAASNRYRADTITTAVETATRSHLQLHCIGLQAQCFKPVFILDIHPKLGGLQFNQDYRDLLSVNFCRQRVVEIKCVRLPVLVKPVSRVLSSRCACQKVEYIPSFYSITLQIFPNPFSVTCQSIMAELFLHPRLLVVA